MPQKVKRFGPGEMAVALDDETFKRLVKGALKDEYKAEGLRVDSVSYCVNGDYWLVMLRKGGYR